MEEIYRSFARPAPGPSRELLGLIIDETGSRGIQRAAELWGAQLAQRSPGWAVLLQGWERRAADALWHPAVGQLKGLAQAGHSHLPMNLIVEVGLLANLDGAIGEWAFEFEAPAHVRFDRWLLPSMRRGEVSAYDDRIALQFEDSLHRRGSISLVKSHSGWALSSSQDAVKELPVILFGDRHRIVSYPGALGDEELLPQYPGAAFEPVEALGDFTAALGDTLDFIGTYAPEYLGWIGDVLRYVLPVRSPGTLIGSSSTPGHWGLISVADDARPLALGELLVHEASHQHFFIASNLGEIDDGSDGDLHYSRFSRRDRPIDRILLAYHALANIALFYESCVANGIARTRCERRLAYITANMHDLDGILEGVACFTSLGRGLWQPLAQQTEGLGMTMDAFLADKELAEAYLIP